MPQVYPAEPYLHDELGPFGRANCMLLTQFNFPDIYEESERMVSMCSYRLNKEQSDRVATGLGCYCLTIHRTLDSGGLTLADRIRVETKTQLMGFIAKILGVDEEDIWTGYRVMVKALRSGRLVFYFELFARDPNGNTPVYTGEPAPNVLPGRRPR